MKIHTVYQATRKKPYIARWYEASRQRNKFFSTEEARAAFIEQFQKTTQRQDPVLPAQERPAPQFRDLPCGPAS